MLKMQHIVDPGNKHSHNFIRASALNHRQFVALLEEDEMEHGDIGSHCPVRWVSLGKVLKNVCNLREQI